MSRVVAEKHISRQLTISRDQKGLARGHFADLFFPLMPFYKQATSPPTSQLCNGLFLPCPGPPFLFAPVYTTVETKWSGTPQITSSGDTGFSQPATPNLLVVPIIECSNRCMSQFLFPIVEVSRDSGAATHTLLSFLTSSNLSSLRPFIP